LWADSLTLYLSHSLVRAARRYPFEPPSIQFVTPIYHPNIDSSGRICLDTLNMPPKGAWKPSLNIPTVLSTVRLLLEHPNPDDGLMADIVSHLSPAAATREPPAAPPLTWHSLSLSLSLLCSALLTRIPRAQTREYKHNREVFDAKARDSVKRNARSGSERLADEAEAPAAEAQDAERGETDDEPPKAKRKSRLGLGSGSKRRAVADA